MLPMIARHGPAISAMCLRYQVRRLEVFGSAARQIDFDPDNSDVDFLVEFRSDQTPPSLADFFAFRDSLAQLLDRPVDLVMHSALRNPFLRADIERSKETVYAA
jgi:predicted nucleotidyltransferase